MVWPIHKNPQLQVSFLHWRHYVFSLSQFLSRDVYESLYRWWPLSLGQVFVKVVVFVRLCCRKSIGEGCAGWSSRPAVEWQEMGRWPPELVFGCPPSPDLVFALPWSFWCSGSFRFYCENDRELCVYTYIHFLTATGARPALPHLKPLFGFLAVISLVVST